MSVYTCLETCLLSTWGQSLFLFFFLVRTHILWYFIVLWRSEWARNDLYNPKFITLIISVKNSGLYRSFLACSDRHRMMKNRQIRVLLVPISKLNWYWQSKNENSFEEKNPIQSDDTCYLTFYRENPMIFFWKIISVLQVSTSAVLQKHVLQLQKKVFRRKLSGKYANHLFKYIWMFLTLYCFQ